MLLELLQCQEYKIMVQITSIWKKKSLGVMSGLFLVEVRLAAHVSFARHGRALAGESPEHAQVVGNV